MKRILSFIFISMTSLYSFNFIKLPDFNDSEKNFSLSFVKTPDAERKKLLSQEKGYQEKVESEIAKTKIQIEEEKEKNSKLFADIKQQKKGGLKGFFAAKKEEALQQREEVARQRIELLKNIQTENEKYKEAIEKFIGTLQADIDRPLHEQESKSDLSSKQLEAVRADVARHELSISSLQKTIDFLKEDIASVINKRRIKEQDNIRAREEEDDVRQREDNDFRDSELEDLYLYTESVRQQSLSLFNLKKQQLEKQLAIKKVERAIEEYLLSQRKADLESIKENIRFTKADVRAAEKELEEITAEQKDEIDRISGILKGVERDRNFYNERLRELRLTDVQTKQQEVRLELVERQAELAEQRQKALEAEQEFCRARIDRKRIYKNFIDSMHFCGADLTGKVLQQKIDDSFKQFKADKKEIEVIISSLENRLQKNKAIIEDLSKYLTTVKERQNDGAYASVRGMCQQIERFVSEQIKVINQQIPVDRSHLSERDAMNSDCEFTINELDREQRSLNIWQRSERALSLKDLQQALVDARAFFSSLWGYISVTFSPSGLIGELFSFSSWSFINLIFALIFFLVFLFSLSVLVSSIIQVLDRWLYIYQGQIAAIYLTVIRSLVVFIKDYQNIVATLLFFWLHIFFNFRYVFHFLSPIISEYIVSIYYLCIIPVHFYLAHKLLIEVKKINQRMSFLFFTERLQDKFLWFVSIMAYSSAALIPLRESFLYSTSMGVNDPLPRLVYGAWTLILVLSALFALTKDDVLKFIPSQGHIWSFIYERINAYYYPVFFFVVGLSILINPYVGYSNFAVYLAFCVPVTLLVVIGLLKVHEYVRKYSSILFMKESDEEEDEAAQDRFEHAKMYYGFFIVLAFLAIALIAFMVITRVWGVEYPLTRLWHNFSEDWVIHWGEEGKNPGQIGVFGLASLLIFLVGGFVVSSLVNRFVLSRLFEIFRIAYGAQNTITRISNYIIIFLAIIFGLIAIKLTQFVEYLFILLLLGIGFGAKDLVSDIFAGLWILVERPLELGNFIEVGGIRGTVKRIAVRATTIRTARNFSIIIPNRELIAKPITNWGSEYYAVAFEFKVTLPYNVDARKMQDLIMNIVQSHKLVLRVPNTTVRLDDFTENGLLFFCRAFISTRRLRDQWDIASQVRIELYDRLREEGVSIPYPQRVVHHVSEKPLTREEFEEVKEQIEKDKID